MGIWGSLVAMTVLIGASYIARPAHAAEYRFYHPDPLGSNVVVTNHTGNVIQRTVHTPYGEARSVVDGQGSSVESGADGPRHLFTGQEHDFESGLHYMNARHYDPFVGKFLSADPELTHLGISFNAIQTAPGNFNTSSYVLNRPTGLVDPTGRFTQPSSTENFPATPPLEEVPKIRAEDRFMMSKIQQVMREAKPFKPGSRIRVSGDPQPVQEMADDVSEFQDGLELLGAIERLPERSVFLVMDQTATAAITYHFETGTGEWFSILVLNPNLGSINPDGSVRNAADKFAHELHHVLERRDMPWMLRTNFEPYENAAEYSAIEFRDNVRLGNQGRPPRLGHFDDPLISLPCPTCR